MIPAAAGVEAGATLLPGAGAEALALSVAAVPFAEMSGRYAVADYVRARARLPQSAPGVEALVAQPADFPYSTTVWLFEQVRQICRDVGFLVAEFIDEGACTPATCPRMQATDKYLFKCAAHQGNKDCCAIDYAVHTLEGAVSLLNSPKAFPNNLDIKASNITRFKTLVRRLYRVLAHAHFHHPAKFAAFERRTWLCHRMHLICAKYALCPKEQMIIPRRAVAAIHADGE
jgi:hypothetical protein